MGNVITYKYRIKDRHTRKVLESHAVACNQVWNWCVAQQRDIEDRYRAGAPKRKWATHFDLTKLTNGVGADLGIPQQTVHCVCFRFAISRDRARRAPRFRTSFGSKRSLGWVPFQKQTRKVNGNGISYFGKVYRFFGSKRRPLPESATGGCFVEDSQGRWWVCFHVEAPERRCGNASVGIDLGLKSFAALSDGRTIGAPRHFRASEVKLAITQRAGNKRRARAIHDKIKNQRNDFLHKLSTSLVRDHGIIAIGNVSSSKLAKTKMAKSVLDAGWSAFRLMLRYKCQQATASYLEVDERFTTVTCSACGSRSGPQGQKGLRIREWKCTDCGAVHDRDRNSAMNILARSAAGPVEGSHRWMDKHGRYPQAVVKPKTFGIASK